MTEQEKAFEEAFMARQQLSRHTGDRETAKAWFISGYAAGECAARQQFTPLYHAVNELMAFMGAHGSAEARGDRAQAVMIELMRYTRLMAGSIKPRRSRRREMATN